MARKYEHRLVERKWQEKWERDRFYAPDIKNPKNKFYNLWMYPYPSGEGLHAGHAFASTGSDIYGRFARMHGRNVFQPIGYDSFGMHAENYALKIHEHPSVMLERTTKHYESQLRKLGHGYDWTRTVTVSNPDYYKWTQWIFLNLFKAGLAYLKEAEVNFCPSCKTVVADEQVIDGRCERCDSLVEKKTLKQWFFRITDYAQRLLDRHAKIDWSLRVITAQKNWIGKKEGAEIKFKLGGENKQIRVFTTRPDTLYGTTFLVVAPDYARKNLFEHISDSDIKEKIASLEKEAIDLRVKDKKGIDTRLFATNPATGKEIPIWVSNYVVSSYGFGAVMGVPAHDERDWEFAKKYSLSIIGVINGGNVQKKAFDGSGEITNSGDWNGKKYPEDFNFILSDIEKRGWGKSMVNFHLRDWLISRQRYWGPPIPLIYCNNCASQEEGYLIKNKKLIHSDNSDWDHFGWWPVSEKDLPVVLPELSDWEPQGEGKGPLAAHPEFYETKCPHCGADAVRETDVSDTFLDSAWYFLRYPTVGLDDSNEAAFDKDVTRTWLPVDLYFGGAEHSVLHLMYARFTTMVLYDLGYLSFDEPFPKFFAHGLMIKDGAKMSKSRGNVVNPDSYIEKYGADTLRLYLVFMGPMDGSPDFRDEGIEGMARFVRRVWELANSKLSEDTKSLEVIRNQTIKKVTEDIEAFKYNTALAQIMIYVNSIKEQFDTKKSISKEDIKILTLLLAPFAPHLTEEVWHEVLGEKNSIHIANWPKFDEKYIREDKVTIPVQINGKLRGTIAVNIEDSKDKEKIVTLAKKDESVSKWIMGEIKKIVFIPGKLLNFVT